MLPVWAPAVLSCLRLPAGIMWARPCLRGEEQGQGSCVLHPIQLCNSSSCDHHPAVHPHPAVPAQDPGTLSGTWVRTATSW